MSNIFDQFDTAKATQSQPQEPQGQPQTKNIFDQFDTKQSGQVQPKSLQNQPQTKNIFDQFDALNLVMFSTSLTHQYNLSKLYSNLNSSKKTLVGGMT
jgi:hypothetical protein